MSVPSVYRSRTEDIMDVPLTAGLPYTWWTAYSLVIPALTPGSVVLLTGQFEVTNDLGYNVQVDRYFGINGAYGSTTIPTPLNPITCSNVTPDIHHLRDQVIAVIDDASMAALGLTFGGDLVVALVLSAASTSYRSGAYLVLEHGYGEIVATVWRP